MAEVKDKREPVDIPNKADEYVMYLFVNVDLKMDKGKMCAQVGHAVQYLTEEIIRSGYESAPPPAKYINYMKWIPFSKKITLKATEAQMMELSKIEGAIIVIDAGRTQIPAGSMTVVGFPPCNTLSERFKDYKLL